MAIGGSMTATTQARVRYMPSQTSPVSQPGAPRYTKRSRMRSPSQNRPSLRRAEG